MAIADIHAGRELFTVFSSSPMSGGERQPDAELKLDRGLGKANLAQSTYPVRSVWLANPEGMGGPDSQRGISLRRKP